MTQARSGSVRPKARVNPRPREAAARYVYVMTRDKDVVKVGVSGNVERRRNGIQAASPDRVTVFHKVKPVGLTAFEVEKAVLSILSPWRTSGEWFKCPPELARVAVRSVCEGAARLSEFFPLWHRVEAALKVWEAADRTSQRVRRARTASRPADAKQVAREAEDAARAAYYALYHEAIERFPAEVAEIDPPFFALATRPRVPVLTPTG